MIWEPFAMALVLGLLMSAGLYFAYLWPSVEPDDDEDEDEAEAEAEAAAENKGKEAARAAEPEGSA